MSTLTLTLDDDLLAQAEAYARRTGVDLSELITGFLAEVAHRQQTNDSKPAAIRRLRGAITLPLGQDYKQALTEALRNRFSA